MSYVRDIVIAGCMVATVVGDSLEDRQGIPPEGSVNDGCF